MMGKVGGSRVVEMYMWRNPKYLGVKTVNLPMGKVGGMWLDCTCVA